MAPRFVDVLVPVALDQAYSYRVPDGMALSPGDIVDVPLGARAAMGVVWADDVAIKPGLHNRMKEVEDKLDIPALRPELRRFVDWVSGYTLRRAAWCCAWRCGWGAARPRAREGGCAACRPAAQAS